MNLPKLHVLRGFLSRARLVDEDTFLLITAVLVGVGTGVGAILVRSLVEAVSHFSFEFLPRLFGDAGPAFLVIAPTVGGLLVGILVQRYAREAKGHGVPEVMEAVALRGGRIRPIVALVKALASALTIGTGGSAGSEGPIVQIGASLGSSLGQVLHLSDDRIRNLVACGAAGGIAATFNTPIAGVIFALEVILGAFSVRYFSTVVISSVIASVIGRAIYGDLPTFPLPVEYGVASLWEFALYPVLGILAAISGAAFIRCLYFFEDGFDAWRAIPEWSKPALGGLLLGSMALLYPRLTGVEYEGTPHIFGAGYEIIVAALNNELLLSTVLVLLLLKLIATCLTLGSGGSGGVFAPALFLGAMLGTAFAIGVETLFPGVVAPPGAYALLGMAAVFAASAHAPITAIIILGELTDDHRIVLPLMLAVIVATLTSRLLMRGPVDLYPEADSARRSYRARTRCRCHAGRLGQRDCHQQTRDRANDHDPGRALRCLRLYPHAWLRGGGQGRALIRSRNGVGPGPRAGTGLAGGYRRCRHRHSREIDCMSPSPTKPSVMFSCAWAPVVWDACPW